MEDNVEIHDYTTSISGVGLLTVTLLVIRVLEVVMIPWYIIVAPVIINFIIQMLFNFLGFISIRKKLVDELQKLQGINEAGMEMIIVMKTHIDNFEDGE